MGCDFNARVKVSAVPSAGADHALLSFSFVCVASLGTVFTSAGGLFLSCAAPLSSAGIFLGRSSTRAQVRGTETQPGPRDRAFVWKQIALGEQNQHFLRQNKEHQAQLPHPGSFSSRLTFLFGFSCPGMAQGSAAEGFGFSTQTPWSHSLTTEQQSRFFALLQEASPEFPRMLQDGEHGRREFCHSHFPKWEGGEHPQR